ncbi:Putative universal stress protein [Methylacidimicrobium cyclopophantes]|uniref:Universal stress protein n=1 Tax=Methylacidimicrobium cyclopophantes TaxID=1041766 RepID=A0A5E6MCE8_9BACT|nr:universal stress protein [Methylacidimicrobium cyclopophantes]VVM06005.1 Putative universal stress protein [Methylacidimicrobium cyclopophantes]
MPGFQKILVGFDGSKGGEAAFELALEIAVRFGATVEALAIVPPPGTDQDPAAAEERELLRAPLERIAALAREKGVPFSERIEVGDPAQQILHAAGEGRYDLVVVGRRKLARPVYWILGSVSERVIRESPCPVLVVEPPQ